MILGGNIKERLQLIGWDKMALAMVYAVLSYFLLFEVLTTPIYSDADLDRERENAVLTARNGDLEQALLRLESLSNYAKSNQKLWQDFAIVLTWAGQDRRALDLISHIRLEEAPDYFIKDMWGAAKRIDSQSYQTILSPYLATIFVAKQENEEPMVVVKTRPGLSDELTITLKDTPAIVPKKQIKLEQLLRSESELEAVAKQLRDSQDYAGALEVYREGIERFPRNRQFGLGEALCLFELNQSSKASEKLEKLLAKHPRARDVKKAWIYVLNSLRDYPAALGLQTQLLKDRENLKTESSRWSDLARLSYEETPQQWLAVYQDVVNRYPDNIWLREDYMRRLSWSDQYEKALTHLKKLNPKNIEESSLEAAAYAARHVDLPLALSLYQLGEARFPENVSFSRGIALVLAEMGKLDEANKKLLSVDRTRMEIRALYELAEQFEGNQAFLDAQATYQQILAFDPAEERAFRRHVINISRLGLPELAYSKAQTRPQLFSNKHWRELLADRAAIAIRLSQLSDIDQSVKQQRLQTAIKHLNDYQAFLKEHYPNEDGLNYSASIDRLLVLSLSNQFEKVLQQFNDIEERYDVEHALNTLLLIANANLNKRRPKQAERYAKQVLSEEPNHYDGLTIWYYSLIDQGKYHQAERVVEQFVNSQAIWRYGEKPNIIKPNLRRASAELLRAMNPAYSNQLADSAAALSELSKKAPTNTDIQTQQSVVDRWRGHPRLAKTKLTRILKGEPNLQSAQIAYAYTLMDLREYEATSDAINLLNAQYPNDPAIEKLNRTWASNQRQSLRLDAGWGESKGSEFSSNDFQWELTYTTAALDKDYRGFARLRHLQSEFSSTDAAIKRLGVGARMDKVWGGLSIELSQSLETDDLGLTLSGYVETNDVLSFQAALQTYSDSTPVRAYENDISLSTLSLSSIYEPHEKQLYGISIQAGEFSDNNRRLLFGATGRQSLIIEPRYDIRLHEYFSLQTNSEDDAPYYNPESRAEIGLGLEYNGLISQEYEKHFKHRVRMDLAQVKEADHDAGAVWSLDYRHFWQRDIDLKWYYGVAFGRQIYDGDSETYRRLFFGGEWRF
ncbi:MAG: poly-beta-1,6 N-acetyl-D-glucosamine export porin PgaA [Pseudomonadales bacterium]|nr:poly-beta-1,6 N-acetyl-D-glucosamine export porin PgaA [Pseudomonadales bacterium]